MITFDSFSDWWQCVESASVHLVKFLWQTLQVVFIGLASLSCALWRRTVRAVGNYPTAALTLFLVAAFFIWYITFVSMRARAVTAEGKLGKVSYEYAQFKERHGYE